MVQIIDQANPFGKLAENFGRNLGESFGEESQRQLSVSGLPRLAEQLKKEGVTDRLDLYTRLAQQPGMTQERLQTLLPMFESSLRSRGARKLGESIPSQQGSAQDTEERIPIKEDINITEQAPSQSLQAGVQELPVSQKRKGVKEQVTTLMTPEHEKALIAEEYYPSSEERLQRAVALQEKFGVIYPTLEHAEKADSSNIESENAKIRSAKAKAETLSKRTEEIRKSTSDRINSKLQTANLSDAYAQLPGTIQDTLINKAIGRVKSGETVEGAANNTAKEALNTVRQINQFKNETNKSLFGRGDDQTIASLSKYRKVYEELGALDEYRSVLKEKGFGDHMASKISYPISVPLKKELGKLKLLADPKGLSKIIPSEAATQVQKIDLNKIAMEKAPIIADAIGADDSIEAAALVFNDMGYDESFIYDEIDKRIESGDFEPSPAQEREMSRRLPVDPSLPDLLSAATPGVARGKYGFWETVFRKYGGKR